MDLPDGDYTVAFNGYVVTAQKEGGLWMPDGTTVVVPTEEPSRARQRAFRVEEAVEILPILKDHVA